MAKSLTLAQNAMAQIVARVPASTLSRTSFAASVVKLANGTRAVLVTEAGASASGIGRPLLDAIENAINAPVFGGANPVPGSGTWHMNDAEQQALRTLFPPGGLQGALAGSVLKAVVANRNICPSCTYFLQQKGMIVAGAHAVAP